MRIVAPILLVGLVMLSGCRTADEVATSSYNAAAAPATTTTVTTTTTTNPVSGAVETRPRPTPHSEQAEVTTAETKPATTETKPQATPRSTPAEVDYPTAKPVEGKPGYVYSPFDPGKYVDVSGYAPGSKVKDPYSGKIFKVP
jgi:hypothetical protein